MKKLILAITAATALGGCIAVPVHDSGPGAYYGPGVPAIGIYVAPPPVMFYGNSYRGHSYRGHRGHRRYR